MPKASSAAALAMATAYRAFDSELSEEEVQLIAARIDEYRTGTVLNPSTQPLANSDEPVARFAVAESS